MLLRKPMKLCTYTEGTNSVLHTQKGEVVFSLTERSFHYVPPNDFLSRSHRPHASVPTPTRAAPSSAPNGHDVSAGCLAATPSTSW